MSEQQGRDELERALAFLARTPRVLRELLLGLDERWLAADEGPGTYSPAEVVGHLVQAEETNWIPRARHLLEHGPAKAFVPFDREGMRAESRPDSLAELLARFERRRARSLEELSALGLAPEDMLRPGLHPELGAVTLGQLLSTWVAHDLAHLAQVARVLAKARAADMGPWTRYFRVLTDRG